VSSRDYITGDIPEAELIHSVCDTGAAISALPLLGDETHVMNNLTGSVLYEGDVVADCYDTGCSSCTRLSIDFDLSGVDDISNATKIGLANLLNIDNTTSLRSLSYELASIEIIYDVRTLTKGVVASCYKTDTTLGMCVGDVQYGHDIGFSKTTYTTEGYRCTRDILVGGTSPPTLPLVNFTERPSGLSTSAPTMSPTSPVPTTMAPTTQPPYDSADDSCFMWYETECHLYGSLVEYDCDYGQWVPYWDEFENSRVGCHFGGRTQTPMDCSVYSYPISVRQIIANRIHNDQENHTRT